MTSHSETRRLESIASSPVYSLLSEAMAGLATLRSLGAVGLFQVGWLVGWSTGRA